MVTNDKLKETHDTLVRAIESLTSGEDWKNMLDLAARFTSYSSANVLLIMAQRPEASRVAGYRTWKSVGRHVRAGEHGIAILAPCVYRARPVNEEEERTQPKLAQVLRGFRAVHVFDVTQTDGAELPEVAPVLLEQDAPSMLWDRLTAMLSASGYQLLRADCRPANGTTHYLARTVVVRPDLSPAQAAKTLAHEIAHTMLHDGTEYGKGRRGVVEIEAESVAYLVCAGAGVDTGGYSFPYIARWAGGDIDAIRKTAERVITCARTILTATGLSVETSTTVTSGSLAAKVGSQ